MDFTFGILGIIGGLLCAAGDILLDLKGRGNVKSGPFGMLDSNWHQMASWRFDVSLWLAALGVPLFTLSYIAMSRQLARASETLSTAFLILSMIGCAGSFFIHAFLCIIPNTSKLLRKEHVPEDSQNRLYAMLARMVMPPLLIQFTCLIFVPTGLLIYAILSGQLAVSPLFLIVNPIGLMIIGRLCRLINRDLFADLPGIIMPSVGIAMIGLMTALSALA